jgi:serine/threonine protein phosphatase PrpC
VKFKALSDTGLKREKNEDSWNIVLDSNGNPIGFVVADGMGGYLAGEEASRIAVEEISSMVMECVGTDDTEKMHSIIIRSIDSINGKIMEFSNRNLGGLKSGTTLSIGILKDTDLHVAHIGDSRVYLIRDSVIRPVTQDHTFVAELVRGGLISSDEAQSHPDKNKITRALGFKENYLPDFYRETIQPGDVFIFCTDGLYEHLNDQEILGIVNEGPIECAPRRLIEAVNRRGGNDNTTVIIAWM